jgi:hypothetical protein
MLLSPRAVAATGHGYGPGGSRCPCCAPAPKARKANRRSTRRRENQTWQAEVRKGNV